MSSPGQRQVYIVTGGTRGIGAAVARRLAGVPGRVLLLGYRGDEDSARAIVAELDRPEAPVLAARCDVADPAAVEELFATADRHGPLVGLVNNAGVLERQCSLADIDADRWRRVLDVNVVGLALCCREAVRRMRAHDSPGRAIVNVSSRAAVLGGADQYVDYAASKGAVDTITRGLALEVAPYGIRVTGVRPGIIATDIHASGGDPDRAARLGPGLPLGRAGTPRRGRGRHHLAAVARRGVRHRHHPGRRRRPLIAHPPRPPGITSVPRHGSYATSRPPDPPGRRAIMTIPWCRGTDQGSLLASRGAPRSSRWPCRRPRTWSAARTGP